MKNMIKYKGYIGFFTFDEEKNIFLGKVSNTCNFITFQGNSVETTKQAFKDAINDYIAWCKKYGKKPDKPFHITIDVETI